MWAERKEKGSVDFDSCDILNAVGSERLDSESIPMSSETKKNLEELQRNITQDFSKKMQEWEKLKMTAPKQFQNTAQQGSSQLSSQQLQQQQQQHQQQQQQQFQQQSPKLDRKGSSQKIRKGKPEKSKEKVDREVKGSKQREKELQWLEKQLQKVEREKQRLAKERQKYLEREARLEKMKETMMKPKTNEILIRTSAGEFRFEGISQTFTRKLYEWEEMKGIGPEVSTIALLDSNKPSDGKGGHPLMTKMSKKPLHTLAPPALKFGRMDRNRSRSESSIADIVNVQTSTTSLAPDDLVDDVFADDSAQSRANSEPDIVFNIDEPPCAVEVEEMHIEESIPCTEIPAVHIEEPVYSYTPSEVAYLNDNNDRNIVPTTKGDDTKVVKDATPHDEGNYGQLLDEDIKLLESLTAKEEICRQLENDLEDLDGRMKRMYQQQAEEIRKNFMTVVVSFLATVHLKLFRLPLLLLSKRNCEVKKVAHKKKKVNRCQTTFIYLSAIFFFHF